MSKKEEPLFDTTRANVILFLDGIAFFALMFYLRFSNGISEGTFSVFLFLGPLVFSLIGYIVKRQEKKEKQPNQTLTTH